MKHRKGGICHAACWTATRPGLPAKMSERLDKHGWGNANGFHIIHPKSTAHRNKRWHELRHVPVIFHFHLLSVGPSLSTSVVCLSEERRDEPQWQDQTDAAHFLMNPEKSTDGLLHVCAAISFLHKLITNLTSFITEFFVCCCWQTNERNVICIKQQEGKLISLLFITQFCLFFSQHLPLWPFQVLDKATPAASFYHLWQLTNVFVFTCELQSIFQTIHGLMGGGLRRGHNRFLQDTEWCPITIRSLLSSSDYFLTLHLRFVSPASLNSHLWFSKISFLLFLQTMFFFSCAEIKIDDCPYVHCTAIVHPRFDYGSLP